MNRIKLIIILWKLYISQMYIKYHDAYSILHVNNLSKIYQNNNNIFKKNNYIYALSNITIEFPNNKVIAFIGPSGSGKSTLGKLIL